MRLVGNHGIGRLSALGGVAVLALMPALAAAQSVTPTREELDRAQIRQPEDRATGRVTVDGEVERTPCPLAEPRFANVKVTIGGAEFRNLGPVPAAALNDSFAEFVGREVPIATVCEIRDRAATTIRRMGYLAAVQVPPQRIEANGTVVFDVLMAKLVGIQVRGDAGNSEKLIAASLEPLKNKPAFNVREAERHLLLARDLPGYDVRLSLRPANTVPGEVVGEVTVTRRQFQMEANVQNYGGHAVGRWGGLIRAQINDLTGMGDSTILSVFNTAQTREQTVLQAGHSMAIGADGLRLSGNLTYAWSRPAIVGGGLKSETLIGSLGLSYPVLRRQASNVRTSFGLDWVDQDVTFNGTLITRDHLRVLYAQADFDMIDPDSLVSTIGYSAREPKWRAGGSLEVRQGINALGASDDCGPGPNFSACAAPRVPLGRIEGDPSAFVVRASGTFEYRPSPLIAFSLSPRAQYSSSPLLSYEEMSTGNYTVGRGYDPGTLTGDSGVGFSAEVAAFSLMPKSIKHVAVQPFAFFDAAWIWNNDSTFNGIDPQRLYSAGGGIRAVWGDKARIDFTVAAPLRKAGVGATRRGDVRFLINFTTQILPWNY